MKKIVIGIDPGLYGAVAAIDENCNVLHLFDMPTQDHVRSRKKFLQADVLSDKISMIVLDGAATAVIEKSSARPGQGVSSTFSVGDSFGCARGVLAGIGIKTKIVPAATWKAKLSVTADKELCRKIARELFPLVDLSLKLHHNRAEALLIAYYGLMFNMNHNAPLRGRENER